MAHSRCSGKINGEGGKLCPASVLGSPSSFESNVLDDMGFLDFKSTFIWDDSSRCLFASSKFSFKSWFSGTVSTCSLEALQLYVKSHGRRAEACSCTPTTQVAVVCLGGGGGCAGVILL